MKFKLNSKVITRQALIAAIYAVLTLTAGEFSYGPVQFRYAEIMNWLAFLDPKNIIGICLGCFIANIWSPLGIIDMAFGTLHTFILTFCMAKTRKPFLASIWASVWSFIIGLELVMTQTIVSELFGVTTLGIMLSEWVAMLLGMALFYKLCQYKGFRKQIVDPTMFPTKESWTGQPAFPFQPFPAKKEKSEAK